LATGLQLSTLKGHSHGVNAVAITPDGKQVVSVSLDKTLKLWDLATREELVTFMGDGTMRSCNIAPDGATVVVGDVSGRVHFLRLEGLRG
jgi:WD40 repeat protein